LLYFYVFSKGVFSLQSNLAKQLDKILTAFSKLDKLPKALIKYGVYVSLAVLTIGCILVLLNYTILPYDSYFDMVSKKLVLTSFSLAAEAIIGGIVMDIVFRR